MTRKGKIDEAKLKEIERSKVIKLEVNKDITKYTNEIQKIITLKTYIPGNWKVLKR